MRPSAIPHTRREQKDRRARKLFSRIATRTGGPVDSPNYVHKNQTIKAGHVRGGHAFHEPRARDRPASSPTQKKNPALSNGVFDRMSV